MGITAWAEEYFQKSLSVNTVDCSIHKFRLQLDPETLPSRRSQSSFIIYWDKLENFMDISSSRLTSHCLMSLDFCCIKGQNLKSTTWKHESILPCIKSSNWFLERDNEFSVLIWSPNLNPIQDLWDVVERESHIMDKSVLKSWIEAVMSIWTSTLTHKTQQATSKTTYYWSDNCCG